MKRKLVIIGVLFCALSGFGIGLCGQPQFEAEAALLPDNTNEVEIIPDLAVYSPEPETANSKMPAEQSKLYTEADIDMLARLIYTEARGVKSKTEQAAVVWCVLNRLDNPDRLQKTIADVVTAPYQFDYRPWVPMLPEFEELAEDVLERWEAEKQGEVDVGRATEGSPASPAGASRILPAEYQYFEGWGGRNWFSTEWKSDEYWDWSLPSPYED